MSVSSRLSNSASVASGQLLCSQFRNTKSLTHISRYFETQESQEPESLVSISDRDSIRRFPVFNFAVRSLVSLSSIVINAPARGPETVRVSALVAILDLSGPSSVVTRKGRSIGTTVTLLELIVGDESNTTAIITVWSELAERWGSLTEDTGVKKGDIVVLESMSDFLQAICG